MSGVGGSLTMRPLVGVCFSLQLLGELLSQAVVKSVKNKERRLPSKVQIANGSSEGPSGPASIDAKEKNK